MTNPQREVVRSIAGSFTIINIAKKILHRFWRLGDLNHYNSTIDFDES